MMTEVQMEMKSVEETSLFPIAGETSDSAALVELGEDALDDCSGGAKNAGSSTSGFSRNRMAISKGTFAGPNGSGSFSEIMTEEVGSFANETWDVQQ